MKPSLNKSLRIYLAGMSMLSFGVCTPSLGETPFYSDSQIVNSSVSGSTVTAEVAVATEGEGVVFISDGNEYSITASDGDIRVENTDMESLKTSGVAVTGAGSRLVVSNTSPDEDGTDSIYLTGRNAVKTLDGGQVELNAGKNGTVYADGIIGINTGGEGSKITVNGHVKTTTTTGSGLNAVDAGEVVVNGNAGVLAESATGINIGISGKVTITGNSEITAGTAGIYVNAAGKAAISGNSEITAGTIGINVKETGEVTISGNSNITAGTTGIYVVENSGIVIHGASVVRSQAGGVRVNSLSTATFGSDLSVHNDDGHGIAVLGGGSVSVTGHATINSMAVGTNYYGVLATQGNGGVNSSVVLNGASITTASGTYAIGATLNGVVKANAAVYRLNNGVYAAGGGQIEMTMTDGSLMSGKSVMTGTDSVVDLTFEGDSIWTVTGNSQLTNLTLGQGSALQLAFGSGSLTDIITAAGVITLEAGSYIYLTGDLSGLEGNSFDFFSGTVDNQGVRFVGFDGSDWVEYEYTQTGANTFEFSANAPITIEEPGFIPEPATATLGLLGLSSLLLRRRKR